MPRKLLHLENRIEEDHLFWMLSSATATGFIITITKEINENNCSDISQRILWTKQAKDYGNNM